tara:strand:+ start:1603 stop:1758 length:156 start_codon:yes stop_codon:yes gene_type:complete
MQNHQYSLTEIENMIPWEREIYLKLLEQHMQEEREKMKNMKKQSKPKIGRR